MMRQHRTRNTTLALLAGGVAAALTVLLGPASTAQAATVPCTVPSDLYAVTGTMTTLPGISSVNVWGYRTTSGAVTQPGGPTLCVHVGDTVSITLHNQLNENTALLFQGQQVVPDRTGVAPTGTKLYTFTASRPGTYLYEAGLLPNAQHQVAMGLYGALIVRPAVDTQAYDADTAFDDEAVLVLSEIDAALNNRTGGPAGFDMRKYSPRYFLVNGTPHPATAPIPSAAGHRLLLRYVNAGNQYHSMGLLGAHQTVIALDGSPLDVSRRYVAETFGPGQTADALVSVPPSTADQKLAVYDASLLLHSSSTAGIGGMVTHVAAAGSGGGVDTTGPAARAVAYAGGTLTATVDETTTGGATIQAAEYFLDSIVGPGTPMTGTFGAVSADVSAAVTISSGQHILYVRGQDSLGYWGVLSSVLVSSGDVVGPATSSPSLTPAVSNGSSAVALHATGDDTATGGSVVDSAEYFIDSVGSDGSGTSMTVNLAAPVVSLDAAISAGTVGALTEGTHVVSLHSHDAAGNWGPLVTVTLLVDKTGPTTAGVTAAPNPTNGVVPFNASTPAVRVAATTMSDTLTAITGAEAFLCTTPAVGCAVGANGTGIPMAPSDGTYNSPSESGYADIPLATILQLSNGNHTVYVHAKDAAGNWGATSSTTLLVDKVPPAVLTINRVDPDPTTAATVQFLVTFSEPVLGGTAGNFTLANGAGTAGTAITSVSGTGATRTVTVGTGNGGGGTVGLNLTTATGITDLAGNALPTTGLPLIGQVYTQPTPSLYFSTLGNTNPPGVAGTADDADVYLWNGSAFSRSVDVSTITNPLPATANVDGLDRVDATHFYVSFSGDVTIPLPGPDLTVQDEDVAYYDAGTWSVYFDGTAAGLTAANLDIDAFSVAGGTIYFSTVGNTNPPGVLGTADDADIYAWNGSVFSRSVDVSTMPGSLPGGANVDGLVRVDATHFYVSFSGDITVVRPGPDLPIQDEDVAYYDAGSWSVYFNGTARGLTAGNLDLDAFDLP